MGRHHHRTLLAILLLGAAVGVAPTASATPPDAGTELSTTSRDMVALGAAVNPDPNTYPVVLTGDFTGDSNADLFFYSPSAAPDLLYDYDRIETADSSAHEMVLRVHTFDVQGSYRPVVGLFGGVYNSPDDIFWYQPGAAPDMIWDFLSGCDSWECTDPPAYRILPQRVVGTYQPFVGAFSGYGASEIFWYAPGTAPDSIWSYRRDCLGGCKTTRSIRSVTVNGTYRPVVGEFLEDPYDNDDIFWYSPSGGQESLWDYTTYLDTTPTITKPSALQVANNTYRIAAGDLFSDGAADIVFYGPGSTRDSVWDFLGGSVRKIATPEPIGGNYSSLLVLDALGESDDQRSQDVREPEDIFLYDQATTSGRLYEIYRDGASFFFDRYDYAPMPIITAATARQSADAAEGSGPTTALWDHGGTAVRVAP